MNTLRLIRGALATLALVIPFVAGAQERELISGIVRGTHGDSVAYARIHVVGGKIDTTVRTGRDGRFNIIVQRGQSKLTASMIGYAPLDTSIDVNGGDVRLSLTLHELAQHISAVSITAMKRGIRGIVGDSVTMRPIPGVLVSSIARQKKVYTDSEGRFEIDLPVAEQTTMRLVKEGYLSRPATVPMLKDSIADVVYFMTRGKDSPYVKEALVDLENRAAWRSWDTFIANRTDLAQYGAKSLTQGIAEAVIAGRRVAASGLVDSACVFVDGRPMPGVQAWSLPLASVDMVEYYPFGTDKTMSLSARWPREPLSIGGRKGTKFRCEPFDKNGNRQPGGPWIVVWTRH